MLQMTLLASLYSLYFTSKPENRVPHPSTWGFTSCPGCQITAYQAPDDLVFSNSKIIN